MRSARPLSEPLSAQSAGPWFTSWFKEACGIALAESEKAAKQVNIATRDFMFEKLSFPQKTMPYLIVSITYARVSSNVAHSEGKWCLTLLHFHTYYRHLIAA